jgi:phosphate transport system substrate-binding protein
MRRSCSTGRGPTRARSITSRKRSWARPRLVAAISPPPKTTTSWSNQYALGYFGYAYYEANKNRLKAVGIQWDKNKVKEPVLPSEETVLNATYNPLSRPLFIYVNKKSLERPEVLEFVEYYLTKGPPLFKEVKYVPLPAKAYEMALERLKKRQLGSGFGGVPEVGLPVEEILKREPKS